MFGFITPLEGVFYSFLSWKVFIKVCTIVGPAQFIWVGFIFLLLLQRHIV